MSFRFWNGNWEWTIGAALASDERRRAPKIPNRRRIAMIDRGTCGANHTGRSNSEPRNAGRVKPCCWN
jgi:hypothetical protein